MLETELTFLYHCCESITMALQFYNAITNQWFAQGEGEEEEEEEDDEEEEEEDDEEG